MPPIALTSRRRTRYLLACLLVPLAFPATVAQAAARPGTGFACSWNWSLTDGLRRGYVVSGNSAVCGERSGSLALSTRLQEWDAAELRWRTAGLERRAWSDLGPHHFVEVVRRCDGGRYRAEFSWVLRSGGRVVSRLALTKGPITAPVGCQIRLGG